MNKKRFDQLKAAKAIICNYCGSDMCEFCKVERLVDIAEDELEHGEEEFEWEEPYESRDYSPSCPWNAPGMSIRDFI